jgi:hypothetical protein
MSNESNTNTITATESSTHTHQCKVGITGLWWYEKNGVTFLWGSQWPGMKLIVAPRKVKTASDPNHQLCWVPFEKDKSESDPEWPFNMLEDRCITRLWSNQGKNGRVYLQGKAQDGYTVHVYMNDVESQDSDGNPPDAGVVFLQYHNGNGHQAISDSAAYLFNPYNQAEQPYGSTEDKRSDDLNDMLHL